MNSTILAITFVLVILEIENVIGTVNCGIFCPRGYASSSRVLRDAHGAGCFCTMEYKPVCTSDGRKYGNMCEYKCRNPGSNDAHSCGDLSKRKKRAETCMCPQDMAPVCGTNGNTYPNQCELDCAQRESPDLKTAHEGECDKSKPIDPACLKSCAKNSSESVCASDGKVYLNACIFKCVQTKYPDLHASNETNCQNQKRVTSQCMCPTMDFSPVCGSDGITYSNKCLLKCKQRETKNLTAVHVGKCADNRRLKRRAKDDVCTCTKEYTPVCGSDGNETKTYGNMCELGCARRKQPDLKMTKEGPCANPTPYNSSCVCTKVYVPVCGSDGKTYGNMCELGCTKLERPDVKVGHLGKCEQSTSKDGVCTCTKDYVPVCGSDGRDRKTYTNYCEFGCAQGKNKDLKIERDGECEESKVNQDQESKLMERRDNSCACTKENAPVCGSDGNTYGNMCQFNCGKERNPDLKVVYSRSCPKSKRLKRQETCMCNQDMAPVCGSDGKTYPNQCEFGCAQRKSPELKVAHEGQCEEKQPDDGCLSFCSKMYAPVCGSDGKTYGNRCELGCAKIKNSDLKIFGDFSCRKKE